MAELYREYVKVVGKANDEVVEPLIYSTAEEPKHLKRIYIYEVTPTRQNNAIIRIYHERDRIMEFPIAMFLDQSASQLYPTGAGVVEIDRAIPVGERISVGHLSGATASDIMFIAEYELTP